MEEEDKQIEQQAGSDAGENQEDEETTGFDKEDLQCRFYRNEWPETEELVAVSIFYIFVSIIKLRVFRSKSTMSMMTELMYVYWNTTIERLLFLLQIPPGRELRM